MGAGDALATPRPRSRALSSAFSAVRMSDGRALLFLGCTMIMFGSINAYIGFSLTGEKGLENRVRARTLHTLDARAKKSMRIQILRCARVFSAVQNIEAHSRVDAISTRAFRQANS